ncbi:hypothetical protein [uncultured Sphingomonas sp.]|uniref:hypothetical protein n=1 Tax=uncultured Sphingomonas sp. TaxID=158754 RepID=UPI0025D2081D|nr:hypothetical protein [uncultured Sphingomonas sp.]
MDIGVLELCGIGAALSAGLGGPIAVIRWCGGYVDQKVRESERALTAKIDTVTHKSNNNTTRIDAIERLRVTDVERIVKVESNLSNLEKGQERIEHQLEKMEADSEKGRSEIIESIRELRTVGLKP